MCGPGQHHHHLNGARRSRRSQQRQRQQRRGNSRRGHSQRWRSNTLHMGHGPCDVRHQGGTAIPARAAVRRGGVGGRRQVPRVDVLPPGPVAAARAHCHGNRGVGGGGRRVLASSVSPRPRTGETRAAVGRPRGAYLSRPRRPRGEQCSGGSCNRGPALVHPPRRAPARQRLARAHRLGSAASRGSAVQRREAWRGSGICGGGPCRLGSGGHCGGRCGAVRGACPAGPATAARLRNGRWTRAGVCRRT
mmetsp:Transcript_13023/g.31546  ORF Transcript_13023/g.31546 Transcript_13023/m.31546 type:complete len:248 (+) Transcript_13023:225-968(+)